MTKHLAAPYALVTRRWTGLTSEDRDAHSLRLVGTTVADARIGEPVGAAAYGRLVQAAATGDPEAIAWLAWSHRPKLVERGRDLYRADPDEWGSACLEILCATVRQAVVADVIASQWCRRWVTQRLCARLSRHARRECDRRRRERTGTIEPLDLKDGREHGVPDRLPDAGLARRLDACPSTDGPLPVPDLHDALIAALAEVDASARELLLVLADDHSPGRIQAVARRHDITSATLRQRLCRARRHLQPQLAEWAAVA